MTFDTFIIKNAKMIMIICLIITGVIAVIVINVPDRYWTDTPIIYEDFTPYPSRSASSTQELKEDVSDKQGVISVTFEEVPNTILEEFERAIEGYEDCMGGGCGRFFMSQIWESKKYERVPNTRLEEELEKLREGYEDCMGGRCGGVFMRKISEAYHKYK